MIRSLYARLAIVLVGVVVLVGAAGIGVTMALNAVWVHEVRQQASASLAGQLVRAIDDAYASDGDPVALRRELERITLIDHVIEPYVLDASGRVLAFTGADRTLASERVSLAPIRAFLGGRASLPIMGDDPREAGGTKIFSVAPMSLGAGRDPGYLYVLVGGEVHDSVVRALRGSYVLRLAALVGLAALLIGLSGGLVGFFLLTRPLHALTEEVERFRRAEVMPRTDLEATAEPVRTDEIARLSGAFDHMAARVREQVTTLTERDALRRELVADVSHDLRTPLAVLRGYLETMRMKEATLGRAERLDYLGVAQRNAERLDGLIDTLFELARLDARDAPIDAEPFSVAELVQDVLASLTLAARDQGTELRFSSPPDLPFVRGEIALIERVLVNLLGNALRHTPADGRVEIGAASHNDDGEAVRFSIINTGETIPGADLPYVFERFYRSDTSRSRDETGMDAATSNAGLGLSIVKALVESQHGRVGVQSASGRTEFWFTLPRAE
ncbi:MAG: HAMP domain-containing histidine kinase [Caldilineaceae bacterium]|nr:HAMP domain-containing histidine kinase [Caldilineaceae bacterium]